jgi:hypothetical protein
MRNNTSQKELSDTQWIDLLQILKSRFEQNPHRHEGIPWQQVQARLRSNSEKISSLLKMEQTGGEPDVVGKDQTTDEFLFLIVLPKAPKAEEAYATTARGCNPEKIFLRQTTHLKWPQK